MIEIVTTQYGRLTISDNFHYTLDEYAALIGVLKGYWQPSDIVSVYATGKHLIGICDAYINLSRPRNVINNECGYIWYGSEAQTLFANISLGVQHGISAVVTSVADYDFSKDHPWRG